MGLHHSFQDTKFFPQSLLLSQKSIHHQFAHRVHQEALLGDSSVSQNCFLRELYCFSLVFKQISFKLCTTCPTSNDSEGFRFHPCKSHSALLGDSLPPIPNEDNPSVLQQLDCAIPACGNCTNSQGWGAGVAVRRSHQELNGETDDIQLNKYSQQCTKEWNYWLAGQLLTEAGCNGAFYHRAHVFVRMHTVFRSWVSGSLMIRS